MEKVSVSFRFYDNADQANAGIEHRRNVIGKDPAMARARATFSVLHSNNNPRLYGIVLDHDFGGYVTLDGLANNLDMSVYQRNVMPYYGLKVVGGQ